MIPIIIDNRNINIHIHHPLCVCPVELPGFGPNNSPNRIPNIAPKHVEYENSFLDRSAPITEINIAIQYRLFLTSQGNR